MCITVLFVDSGSLWVMLPLIFALLYNTVYDDDIFYLLYMQSNVSDLARSIYNLIIFNFAKDISCCNYT